MKNLWKFKVLYFGHTTANSAVLAHQTGGKFNGSELPAEIKLPHSGVFLTNGEKNILIDNGLSDEYLANNPFFAKQTKSAGGAQLVLNGLAEIGLTPDDIGIVIYSHLHNDHAGNCHLFKNATHIFQKREWAELLDPLPTMKPLNFDQGVIPKFEKLNCLKVDGDFELFPGINIMLTPGHSAGSQSVIVDTSEGRYAFVGDLMHSRFLAYASVYKKITTYEGIEIEIPDVPDFLNGIIPPTNLIYDHYAWYDSIYKIKAMFPNPEFIIPCHDLLLLD